MDNRRNRVHEEDEDDEETDLTPKTRRLRIGNISGDTSPLDLVDLFCKHFDVLHVEVHLHGDKVSDEAEALVTMSKEDARKAKEWAHGHYWFDRKLEVTDY
jgi:hypothetical protein